MNHYKKQLTCTISTATICSKTRTFLRRNRSVNLFPVENASFGSSFWVRFPLSTNLIPNSHSNPPVIEKDQPDHRTVLITDGTYFMVRARRDAHYAESIGISAAQCFCFWIEYLQLVTSAAAIYVVFDYRKSKTDRERSSASYKGPRKAQLEKRRGKATVQRGNEVYKPFIAAAESLGCHVLLSLPGLEADDMIASLVLALVRPDQKEQQKPQVDAVIASGDKDMAALVGPHVRWMEVRDLPSPTAPGCLADHSEADLASQLGYAPYLHLQYLALVGHEDKGVKGVGISNRAARNLVKRYPRGMFGALEAAQKGLVNLDLTPRDVPYPTEQMTQEHLLPAKLSKALENLRLLEMRGRASDVPNGAMSYLMKQLQVPSVAVKQLAVGTPQEDTSRDALIWQQPDVRRHRIAALKYVEALATAFVERGFAVQRDVVRPNGQLTDLWILPSCLEPSSQASMSLSQPTCIDAGAPKKSRPSSEFDMELLLSSSEVFAVVAADNDDNEAAVGASLPPSSSAAATAEAQSSLPVAAAAKVGPLPSSAAVARTSQVASINSPSQSVSSNHRPAFSSPPSQWSVSCQEPNDHPSSCLHPLPPFRNLLLSDVKSPLVATPLSAALDSSFTTSPLTIPTIAPLPLSSLAQSIPSLPPLESPISNISMHSCPSLPAVPLTSQPSHLATLPVISPCSVMPSSSRLPSSQPASPSSYLLQSPTSHIPMQIRSSSSSMQMSIASHISSSSLLPFSTSSRSPLSSSSSSSSSSSLSSSSLATAAATSHLSWQRSESESPTSYIPLSSYHQFQIHSSSTAAPARVLSSSPHVPDASLISFRQPEGKEVLKIAATTVPAAAVLSASMSASVPSTSLPLAAAALLPSSPLPSSSPASESTTASTSKPVTQSLSQTPNYHHHTTHMSLSTLPVSSVPSFYAPSLQLPPSVSNQQSPSQHHLGSIASPTLSLPQLPKDPHPSLTPHTPQSRLESVASRTSAPPHPPRESRTAQTPQSLLESAASCTPVPPQPPQESPTPHTPTHPQPLSDSLSASPTLSSAQPPLERNSSSAQSMQLSNLPSKLLPLAIIVLSPVEFNMPASLARKGEGVLGMHLSRSIQRNDPAHLPKQLEMLLNPVISVTYLKSLRHASCCTFVVPFYEVNVSHHERLEALVTSLLEHWIQCSSKVEI